MAEPFSAGTVALGLSCVGSTGREIVTRLRAEARLATDAGFDGVTLSEHHAGFEHYLPSPLLVAAQLLAGLDRGFAAACPMILPLRSPVTVAEDLAWLHAAHPGRVGAGFVAGYQKQDFDAVGVDFTGRHEMFWSGLTRVAGALREHGRASPLSADPAIAEVPAEGLPLLAGVGGPRGVRMAARAGVGILLTSLRTPAEVAELVRIYCQAGGAGPVVLIRRVQVGQGPGQAAAGFASSTAAWRSRAGSASWLQAAESALIVGPPDAVTRRLAEAVRVSGSTALDLRLDVYTADPDRVADQISLIAREVLPELRAELGEHVPREGT